MIAPAVLRRGKALNSYNYIVSQSSASGRSERSSACHAGSCAPNCFYCRPFWVNLYAVFTPSAVK
jgi:hypothetical protein